MGCLAEGTYPKQGPKAFAGRSAWKKRGALQDSSVALEGSCVQALNPRCGAAPCAVVRQPAPGSLQQGCADCCNLALA